MPLQRFPAPGVQLLLIPILPIRAALLYDLAVGRRLFGANLGR